MYHVNWNKEVVLKGLSDEARTSEFKKAYQQLRAQHSVLLPYSTPELFIGMLQAKSSNYAQKDRALHAVISAIKTDPGLRQCGLTLLSLAMWPALEHSYYKLIHLSPCVPDLFAEIHGHFLDEVFKTNPEKTSKIAINLQLNAEKRVRQAIIDEAQYQDQACAYTYLDTDLDQLIENPRRNRGFQLKELLDQIPEGAMNRCLRSAAKGQPKGLSDPDKAVLDEALHILLEQDVLTREEYHLIAGHVLLGMELQELARQMGIKNNAVRTRFFRIKDKLRRYEEASRCNARPV
jgi:DNA-directed RNA polymerase specialized sigma24 family protein